MKKCFCAGKKKKLKRRCFLMTSTLGIVTLSSKYEEAFTRGLAKAAPSYGLKVVRFTPFDLKPASNLIQGQTYTNGQGFAAAEFEIPDLIYDRCLYKHDAQSKKAKPIMEWLKKYPKTDFLNTGISNKMMLFEQLRLSLLYSHIYLSAHY